jgi:hypothetical protein
LILIFKKYIHFLTNNDRIRNIFSEKNSNNLKAFTFQKDYIPGKSIAFKNAKCMMEGQCDRIKIDIKPQPIMTAANRYIKKPFRQLLFNQEGNVKGSC